MEINIMPNKKIKVIIPSSKLKLINEANELNNNLSLPKHLLKAVRTHKTSLGEHPSFPPEDEKSFDYKIIYKRFKDLSDDLNKLDGISDFNEDNLKTLLSEAISQCQKIEEPIKEQLEVLCFNLVNSLFNIPEDTVDFTCKLVSNVDASDKRLLPEETDEMEFEGIEELEGLNNDVYKRRLINALVQGASLYYSSQIENYISEIYKLNAKLPELYHKVLLLNNFLLFLAEDKMNKKNPTLAGNVDVHLGNDVVKTQITAEAIIFPILLNESIKGFMELFAAHGLPESKDKAIYVIKKADFLLAEPWDMRLGFTLWQLLIDLLPNKNETNLIPLFFTELVSLPNEEFHKLMREVFGKTKSGRKSISNLYNTINFELRKDNFQDFISNKDLDNTVINDGYFTIEELNTTSYE